MSAFEDIELPLKKSSLEIAGIENLHPIIKNGVAIVALDRNRILAYDESDFFTKWSLDLKEYTPLKPRPIECQLINERLVFHISKTLYIVDLNDGEIVQMLDRAGIGGYDFLDFQKHRRNLNLVAEAPLELYYDWLDLESFKMLRRDSRRFSALAGSEDHAIVVTNRKRRVICIDAATMEDSWIIDTNALPRDPDSILEDENQFSVSSGAFILGDLAIFGVRSFYIYEVEIATGQLVWSARTKVRFPDTVNLGPDGNLHVIDPTNYAVINPENGVVLSDIELGDTLNSHGIYSDIFHLSFSTTHLFFSTGRRALLVALNLATFQVDWTYKCKSGIPLVCFPILVNGRLYTVDLNGELYIFEGESHS